MDANIFRLPSSVQPICDRRSLPTKQISDTDLIGRIISGEKLAMQLLYIRHNVRLFRFALRFVQNPTVAEDVVQEVFLDVWHKAGEFRGGSEVSTWLLAIVRNKALTALRQRSVEQLDDGAATGVEDSADTAETVMGRKQARAIIRRSLARLSPAHREIVDLVYYHERSIADVATIVGIPVNTVKTRMFYARKHLAELLSGQGITAAMA
jgi:RNA polymerase sigma-70 factor (ECF subfamily)